MRGELEVQGSTLVNPPVFQFLSAEDLVKWYSSGDLCVHASEVEVECMSVLEAMHGGIPIAAPLIGGLHDYATPDNMTLLASIAPADIARAVEQVMDNPENARAKAAVAAEKVEQLFGAAAVSARYRALNQEILAKCGALGTHRVASEARAARPNTAAS